MKKQVSLFSALLCSAARKAYPGLPDFSWHKIPKSGKIYQIATKLPHCHKSTK
jgi:hypothetical protein